MTVLNLGPVRPIDVPPAAPDGVAPGPVSGAFTTEARSPWASRRPLREAVDHLTVQDRLAESGELAAPSAPASPAEPSSAWHLAGRILQLRRVGKVGFAQIDDGSARFQLMVRTGDPTLDAVWDACRRGDWVSAHGPLGRTRTGEPSLFVQRMDRVQACVTDVPERFHGLVDPEQRRRQPEMVWAFEDNARRTLQVRAQVLRALRGWFEARGYMEFDTPVLHPIQGGANARPFVTHHGAVNEQRFLRIAPELYLKRALAGGFDRVFEVARCFRNEGLSTRHRPEFTLVEAYASFADVSHWTVALPDLLRTVAQAVGSDVFDQVRCTTMDQAVRDHGIDPRILDENDGIARDAWQAFATSQGLPAARTRDERLVLAFEEVVAPTYDAPVLVQGHPLSISPLAAEDPLQPGRAARFELYARGIELANGYTELTDPQEQRRRLLAQGQRQDGEAMGLDEAFLDALDLGLPPCAGVGLGLDRLVMVLAGEASIQEAAAFPGVRRR